MIKFKDRYKKISTVLVFSISLLLSATLILIKKEEPRFINISGRIGTGIGDIDRVYLNSEIYIELLWIPSGSFTMSADGLYAPPHQVTLDGFWIGKFEVTQEQWGAIMGWNDSLVKGDHFPITCASWSDAQEFLSKAGYGLRLPTEAEWEYAALGKAGAVQYDPITDFGWLDDFGQDSVPHIVGQKKSNDFGIYDMVGNVYEFCQDVYVDFYHFPIMDSIVNPLIDGNCADPDELESLYGNIVLITSLEKSKKVTANKLDCRGRVIRGSDFDTSKGLSITFRGGIFADKRGRERFGFRVARSASERQMQPLTGQNSSDR